MSEIQLIPLAQIKPNPHNPRKVITPEMVSAIAASLKAVGLKNPIKVTANADGTYTVLSGHIRLSGATQLGWESIPAQVLNLTPAEALLEAILDNRGQQMSWLETYMAAESLMAANPKLTKQAIADQLGLNPTTVSRAEKMLNTLKTEAREHILQNLQNPDGYQVPETVIYALSSLEDPAKVAEALKVAIDKKMTASQAKALVASMQTGTPAEAHIPVAASRPHPSSAKASKGKLEAAQSNHGSQLEASTQMPKPTASKAPTADGSMGAGDTSSSLGTGTTKTRTSAGSLGAGENAIWDGLAGISVITQIRAKIKKGERPTWGESFILLIDLLWRGLHWLSKAGWKLAKWLSKELWKTLKFTFKSILNALGPAVKKTVSFVLGLALLIGIVWLAWDIHEHGYLHPFKLAASKLFPNKPEPTSVPTVMPTPMPTAVSVVSASTPNADSLPHASSVDTSSAKLESAQPKLVAQPVVSPQAPTPTIVKKDVVADTAGNVAKSVAPDLAADAAKKLFGL